jgi:alpha-galactosidase
MNIDRDASGNLQADPVKFPSGIKALGDYIHSKGLKFGIYTSVGRFTCEGYPGSFGYEAKDAAQFASWGVDYVKIDWCTYKWIWWPFWNYQYRYELLSKAIQETGRPMVISLCNWGYGKTWIWGREIAHTWRVTYDITPTKSSIDSIIATGKSLSKYIAPGAYNDLDSLEIGNGIDHETSVRHFYWWCMLKSPLILGCDLRTMSDEDKAIVKNMELINYNQT